jgi:hypothetical protein
MMKKTPAKKKMADGGVATDAQGNRLFVSRPAAAVMPAAPAAAPAVAAARQARGRKMFGEDLAATRMKREERRANKAAKTPTSGKVSTMPVMAKGGAVKKGKK